MKRITAFLACFLLVGFIITAPGFGQYEGPLFDNSQGLGDIYGFGDNFGMPDAMGSQVTFTAKIVPAERAYGEHEQGKSYAWLIVDANIRSDSYVYSVTQKRGGGLPTEIKIPENGTFALTGPFFTSTAPKVVEDENYKVPLEEHFGQAVWFAPLSFEGETIPEDATLEGTVHGQACIAGPLGACTMLDEPFIAKFEPDFEIASLIEASEKIDPELGGFVVGAEPKPAFDPTKMEAVEHSKVESLSLAMLYGFLGGLILNIMPCVLPVIGLKILSFFEQAGKSRLYAFKLNVVYSLGLLSVFLVLAGLNVGLNVGLNSMYTSNVFNIMMICIVFVMSLSLMGFWEIQLPSFLGGSKSVSLMQKEGYLGAFFKGIITTLLAIPCGAPLLAPAITWTSQQPPVNVFVIFSCIGLGMASPYLLVGAFPELLRFFPKPGAWMETFKNFMGFALLIAVLWILYYIHLSLLMPTVALLFSLWFACWYIGRIPYGSPGNKHIVPWSVSAAVILFVVFISFRIPGIPNEYNLQAAMETRLKASNVEDEYWNEFSYEKMGEGLDEGRIVMVDFTADWCATCKVFEAAVLRNEKFLKTVDERNILTLQADITHREESDATRLIEQIGGGRSIPIVAIYFPENPNKPTILRGGNRLGTLLDLIEAGPEVEE